MFIGRDAEFEYLDRYYREEGSQILVMYGVKGIGKTEVLKHYTSGKSVSYYAAEPVSGREQRARWAAELKEHGHRLPEFPGYEEILKNIFPDQTSKKILVIDDFHYMVKNDGDFFPALAEFVDRRRISRPVLIVLLSSAAGFIENSLVSVIGSKATYINGIYKLKELPYRSMCRLYPEYSRQDAFLVYMTLGGVPGLWECFDSSRDFRENVIQNILKKRSRLFGEMSTFFADDLREPAVYNTILSNIAQGRSKLNDIFEYTGFSRAKISVYLKNLMELNLIEKISAGVYRISVPVLAFYFRFLFPNKSLLEKYTPDNFYDRLIAPFLSEYAESAYAKICRQEYEAENTDGFDISEWHEKEEQLDLVTVDRDARRVAAICRYEKEFERDDYKKLVSVLRHAKIQPDRLILYSEREESDDLKQLIRTGKIEHIKLDIG